MDFGYQFANPRVVGKRSEQMLLKPGPFALNLFLSPYFAKSGQGDEIRVSDVVHQKHPARTLIPDLIHQVSLFQVLGDDPLAQQIIRQTAQGLRQAWRWRRVSSGFLRNSKNGREMFPSRSLTRSKTVPVPKFVSTCP